MRDIYVYAEQIREVYKSFYSALLGAILGSILLAALQWDVIDHEKIKIWLTIFIIINAARGLLVFNFSRKEQTFESCVKYGLYFFISTILVGIIWAIGVYTFFPANDIHHQLTVAIIIVGLSAGAISTIAIVLNSFIAFVFPMMLTLIVIFLLEANYESNLIAVVLIFTLIFIFRGAKRIHSHSRQNIELNLAAAKREESLIQAKNDAEEANNIKSEFLKLMSHELRTPLHGILSYTQLGIIKKNKLSVEKTTEFFTHINNSGERLKRLLDDLLDLSLLDSANLILNFSNEEILPIIQACINEQTLQLEEKNITVEYEISNNLPKIKCDKNRIDQVIMKILDNAIKHSPKDGHIAIVINADKIDDSASCTDAIHISISDQGEGIPIEEVDTIFDKFAHSSIKPHHSGHAGLGLAISKQLITNHHGKIWCENRELYGAKFHILLPTNQ